MHWFNIVIIWLRYNNAVNMGAALLISIFNIEAAFFVNDKNAITSLLLVELSTQPFYLLALHNLMFCVGDY